MAKSDEKLPHAIPFVDPGEAEEIAEQEREGRIVHGRVDDGDSVVADEKPDSLHDVVGEMFLFMNRRHQTAQPHETGEITKLMTRLRALKEKA